MSDLRIIPPWPDVRMAQAFLLSLRSKCLYTHVGVVFTTSDNRMVTDGYNGPIRGDDHCIEVGCRKKTKDAATGKFRRCRGAHAEMNAVMNCQLIAPLSGGILYTTLCPCYDCMKHIAQLGIKKVVYLREYQRLLEGEGGFETEPEVSELAQHHGIALIKYQGDLFGVLTRAIEFLKGG